MFVIYMSVADDKLMIGLQLPGPKPIKPSRPRKPRETFKRIEPIWSSEDDDILLADLLCLIPSSIRADAVRVNVSKNPTNGYPHVVITYDHEILNTQYSEQLHDYELRLRQYELDIVAWEADCAEWMTRAGAYQNELQQLKDRFENELSQGLDDLERDAI